MNRAPEQPQPQPGTVPLVHAAEEAEPTVSPPLVDAMVPTSVLHGDEVVLLLIRPSIFFIPITSARFSLATALLGWVAIRFVGQTRTLLGMDRNTILTVLVIVLLGRLAWAAVQWTSHVYLLTNQRVITIKGVTKAEVYHLSLRKIQRDNVYQPSMFYLLNLGTIGYSTDHKDDYVLHSVWELVSRPREVHRRIVDAIHKLPH